MHVAKRIWESKIVNNKREFAEVAHSGGRVTFEIRRDPITGNLGTSTKYESSRPVPTVIYGVYALLNDGITVADFNLGGIGQAFSPPPPLSGCVPVFLASDSEGRFGHLCPNCGGYWRTDGRARVCPYCSIRAEPFQFMSDAQKRYVAHWCKVLREGLEAAEETDVC